MQAASDLEQLAATEGRGHHRRRCRRAERAESERPALPEAEANKAAAAAATPTGRGCSTPANDD